MHIATIQVYDMVKGNHLPLRKMENYDNTININFWTHSSKLPHSMNVILATLIGTLTQLM